MALFILQKMINLKSKAIKLNACVDAINSWDESNPVEMYKSGITWCMEKKFPSFYDMEEFDSLLENSNVYNLKNIDITAVSDIYVLNGTVGKIVVSEYSVSRIYIGRGSVVDIELLNNSHVIIDIYDNSVAKVSVPDSAKCAAWKHGDSSIVVLNGSVKITTK